ncbi:hypothetical protein [Streptococcus pneumoniae]|uniref:hypothetical protein n=2 Tax=Streptococcus pneumoniae TaxID=1313 RepID=UPI001C92F8EF|nr:hypothetical protein [Streptococcus pneumoniae]
MKIKEQTVVYSIKIKEQTRKLAALAVGCSKHSFEVVDRTDEVSNIYTHTYIYGKATLTRFEEIFEEYKNPQDTFFYPLVYKENTYEKNCYFYLCSPNVRSLLPVPIQPAKL